MLQIRSRNWLDVEPGSDGRHVPGGGLHTAGVQGEGGVTSSTHQPVLLPVLNIPLAGAHLQPGESELEHRNYRQ